MAIIAAGLIAFAIALGCVAGPVMDKRHWLLDHAGSAIACWIGALTGTFVALAGTAVIALFWPPAPGHGLLEWIYNCLPRHRHAGVVLAAGLSLALIAACGARLARGIPRLWRAIRHRRRHRQMLHVIAREHDRHADVLVLDHPVPVAYCVPSRHRSIVVTTGAQDRLSAAQLRAVLAHERAHLRQRHHGLLLLLDLANALLPWLPTIRRARTTLPLLLEAAADDAAARTCGRGALAGALRELATFPGVADALAATGPGKRTVARRLARLESPAEEETRSGARVLAWTFFGSAVGAPLVVIAIAIAQLPLPC
jgi:beta-lactamase regulating signal transducer with metallopeptidase domain